MTTVVQFPTVATDLTPEHLRRARGEQLPAPAPVGVTLADALAELAAVSALYGGNATTVLDGTAEDGTATSAPLDPHLTRQAARALYDVAMNARALVEMQKPGRQATGVRLITSAARRPLRLASTPDGVA